MKHLLFAAFCGSFVCIGQDQSTSLEAKNAALVALLRSPQTIALPVIAQIRTLRAADPLRISDDITAAKILAARDGKVSWWVWGLDKDVVSKEIWVSGSRFRAIILNDDHGVILAASMERQKDMVSATIVVANLHEKQLDVMPSEITLHDLGANSRTLEIVPPEKVAAKALKGTWEEFFLGISASGANTTVHTAKGDSFEVPDVEARANATRTLNERAAEKRQRAADVNSSALREHTLFQRQNTVGKLHFKAGKPAPKEVVLRVPLRGLIYEIPFELPAK